MMKEYTIIILLVSLIFTVSLNISLIEYNNTLRGQVGTLSGYLMKEGVNVKELLGE